MNIQPIRSRVCYRDLSLSEKSPDHRRYAIGQLYSGAYIISLTVPFYFHDPEIGVVNSTISHTDGKGKRSFIRYVLNSICINGSISGSSLNIHGALYAQRRSVFVEFPNDILFDDLFAIISTIGQKKRLVQSNEALITDVPFETYYNRNRLERLARGLLIFLFRYWKDIKKLPIPIVIRFLLYRYLKLLLPYLVLGLVIPVLFYASGRINPLELIIFTGVWITRALHHLRDKLTPACNENLI